VEKTINHSERLPCGRLNINLASQSSLKSKVTLVAESYKNGNEN